MAASKAFGSLSPSLLARKGSARPAMRPQVAPLVDFPSATPHSPDEDLGWDDLGEPADTWPPPVQMVAISAVKAPAAATPEVLLCHQMLARSMARSPKANSAESAKGKRTAFTLRIDAERHLKLRLACTLKQRSAQQLLTEALDTMLTQLPEIQPMAGKAGKRR